MTLFEDNVVHQRVLEDRTLDINEEMNRKALENQALAIHQDGENIRRGQWIAGGLICLVLVVFILMIWAAYSLFMHDKVWPAAAFTGMAGALGWAFRSIVVGYLGKQMPPKS